jgi:hypothetical protein
MYEAALHVTLVLFVAAVWRVATRARRGIRSRSRWSELSVERHIRPNRSVVSPRSVLTATSASSFTAEASWAIGVRRRSDLDCTGL